MQKLNDDDDNDNDYADGKNLLHFLFFAYFIQNKIFTDE